jgi:hypothetical protein
VLTLLRPELAVEIGTYTGGSLEIIAPRCTEVHTFDLVSHVEERQPNVTYHLGDSRQTVAEVLAGFADEGRTVDFVLIDGDHERSGVAADVRNVLDSPAARRTVVLLHDVANEDVRAGIRDAGLDRPYVAHVDLSFTVPADRTRVLGERWGGFGLIVVDEHGDLWPHQHGLAPNTWWTTSVSQPVAWRVAAPLRRARRRAGYRARPWVRKLRGTRGVRLEG